MVFRAERKNQGEQLRLQWGMRLCLQNSMCVHAARRTQDKWLLRRLANLGYAR